MEVCPWRGSGLRADICYVINAIMMPTASAFYFGVMHTDICYAMMMSIGILLLHTDTVAGGGRHCEW